MVTTQQNRTTNKTIIRTWFRDKKQKQKNICTNHRISSVQRNVAYMITSADDRPNCVGRFRYRDLSTPAQTQTNSYALSHLLVQVLWPIPAHVACHKVRNLPIKKILHQEMHEECCYDLTKKKQQCLLLPSISTDFPFSSWSLCSLTDHKFIRALWIGIRLPNCNQPSGM